MGVDSQNVGSGRGRNSVRITSKKFYDAGSLIILDLEHMPGNACGVWPAFWTTGPTWPNNGEIDIIEGVNTQAANHYAVHTTSGCSISDTGLFSGTITAPNCDVNAAGQPTNAGCSITTSDTLSFGDGFNAQQGGAYATEYKSDSISIYFFPRSSIPSDIASGSPDPSSWGKPHAYFGSPCNMGQFVKQQQIVINTAFCGDWASGVWSTDSVCSAKASSCQDYVQNNPSAFQETYWSINNLKVYSGSGSGGGQPAPVNTFSQKPTASVAAPSGFPSSPPDQSGPPVPQFTSGQPQGQPPVPSAAPSQFQPQSQGQPQGQPWWGGNNWDQHTVSAWNGGQWGQGKANAAATSTAGEFDDASSATVAASVNTASAAVADATTPQDANTGSNDGGGGSDNQNANVDASAPALQAAAQVSTQAQVQSQQTQAATPNEPQDGKADHGQAQASNQPQSPSSPPSATLLANPSNTVAFAWGRPNWTGRYATVRAMQNDDFGHWKREQGRRETAEAEAEDVRRREAEESEVLRRREAEESEVLRRRDKKASGGETESKERRHIHRHEGKQRKRGWWRA